MKVTKVDGVRFDSKVQQGVLYQSKKNENTVCQTKDRVRKAIQENRTDLKNNFGILVNCDNKARGADRKKVYDMTLDFNKYLCETVTGGKLVDFSKPFNDMLFKNNKSKIDKVIKEFNRRVYLINAALTGKELDNHTRKGEQKADFSEKEDNIDEFLSEEDIRNSKKAEEQKLLNINNIHPRLRYVFSQCCDTMQGVDGDTICLASVNKEKNKEFFGFLYKIYGIYNKYTKQAENIEKSLDNNILKFDRKENQAMIRLLQDIAREGNITSKATQNSEKGMKKCIREVLGKDDSPNYIVRRNADNGEYEKITDLTTPWSLDIWYTSYRYLHDMRERLEYYTKTCPDANEQQTLVYKIVLACLDKVWIECKPNDELNTNTKRKVIMNDTNTLDKVVKKVNSRVLGRIRLYFCSKFIQCGKYCTINSRIEEIGAGRDDLSYSMYYEVQKALDHITSSETNVVSFAIGNLYSQGVDIDNRDTVQNLNLESIFNSASVLAHYDEEGKAQLKKEAQSMVYKLRNSSFHSVDSGTEINTEHIDKVIAKELGQYKQMVYQQMLNNNVFDYYNEDLVVDTVNMSKDSEINLSYMPSFRYVNNMIMRDGLDSEHKLSIDPVKKNAQTYLLKKIYLGYINQDMRYDGIEDESQDSVGKQIRDYYYSKNLREQYDSVVSSLKDEKDNWDTLANICSKLLLRQNWENAKRNNVNAKSRHNHFKIFADTMMKFHFSSYVLNNFSWVLSPNVAPFAFDANEREKEICDKIQMPEENVYQGRAEKEYYPYYVIGKLCGNKPLNTLINEYTKYICYIEDVIHRYTVKGALAKGGNIVGGYDPRADVTAYIANIKPIDEAKAIQNILNKALSISNFKLTYNNDYFKENMGREFFDEHSYIEKSVLDKYTQGNYQEVVVPKRNLVKLQHNSARAVLDSYIDNHPDSHIKITAKDYADLEEIGNKIDECYQKLNKKEVYINDWLTINKYSAIKNKVELQNLVDYCDILIEMQTQLVDWCLMREQSISYFLTGRANIVYANMAGGEIFDQEKAELKKELEMIRAIFDFSKNKSYDKYRKKYKDKYGNDKKEPLTMNSKLDMYLNRYDVTAEDSSKNDLYQNLFIGGGNNKHSDSLRNNIDHFNIISGNDRNKYSMFEYYANMYTVLLTWDKKVKNNVFQRFCNILKKSGVNIFDTPIIKFAVEDNATKIVLDIAGAREDKKHPNNNFLEDRKLKIMKKNKGDDTKQVVNNKTPEYAIELLNILNYKPDFHKES